MLLRRHKEPVVLAGSLAYCSLPRVRGGVVVHESGSRNNAGVLTNDFSFDTKRRWPTAARADMKEIERVWTWQRNDEHNASSWYSAGKTLTESQRKNTPQIRLRG